MRSCEWCGKSYEKKLSLGNHARWCEKNPNRISYNYIKRSNQFLKAEELGISKPIVSEETRKKIADKSRGRPHTEETRKKLSVIAKKRKLGGNTSKYRVLFQKNDGVIVYLQSSFEVKFASILEELDIVWSRPEPFVWVDSDGDSHRYYPDFKVGDIYIDTKNDYLVKVDEVKINSVRDQNKIDLRIVTEKDINKEFIASLV